MLGKPSQICYRLRNEYVIMPVNGLNVKNIKVVNLFAKPNFGFGGLE